MNARRRKDLEKAIELLEQAREIIEYALNDEQEAYDNLPEGIQDSERGDRMYQAIDSLEDAESGFDDIIDSINEAIEA